MSALASAAEMVTQDPTAKHEFDHGSLVVRANTLVVGNAIYPIANISTITFSDLRTPVPRFVWITLGVGVVFMFLFPPLGFLLVAFAGWLLYLNWKSKAAADYSLTIKMNAGNTAVILGNNGDFLKAIALELYDVIELEIRSSATFNIDQSVKIDNITGSAVAVGGVRGDIVNNVQRI